MSPKHARKGNHDFPWDTILYKGKFKLWVVLRKNVFLNMFAWKCFPEYSEFGALVNELTVNNF